jgi:hypothetical protein
MTRDETIALWQRCEDARAAELANGKTESEAHQSATSIWNSWAKKLLEERAVLERMAIFKIGKHDFQTEGWIGAESCGLNEVTSEWLQRAQVDFHGHVFEVKARFENFIFPGYAIFGESKRLTKNRATRPSVIFKQGVEFGRARFHLDAIFDWSVFSRAAGFSDVIFFDIARFDQCVFEGTAWFHRTEFRGEVWMGQVKFRGYTDFNRAKFDQRCSFRGSESEGSFILDATEFKALPEFTQATFQGAPRIDDIRWPKIDFFPSLSLFQAKELQAHYRAIRQLATQGQDHENETRAFRGEVRSKRGEIDKWYHPTFWFGVFYDALSDFGSSILRPLLGWLICIGFFAVYFLGQTPEVALERQRLAREGRFGQIVAYTSTTWQIAAGELPNACVSKTLPTGDPQTDSQNGFTGLAEPVRRLTNPVDEALSISYHNAVIVLDSNGESAHRAFGCLYGVERYGGNPIAYVPRNVAIASGIQKLFSAVFIFLFGLALRNKLKVK